MSLPKLALTTGEPAGIGPDLCIQIAQKPLPAILVVYADPDLLQQRAEKLQLPLKLKLLNDTSQASEHTPGQLQVKPLKLNKAVTCGLLDTANAAYVLHCLRLATEDVQQGKLDALVTAPVHKGIINEAGIHFTGHTEYLADLTNGDPVMMLACEGLRVALATTHLPLSAVSQAITKNSLKKVIEILNRDLQQRFAIKRPNIFVCGLNPHAGEGGHLGTEEIETIGPVLEQLREQDNMQLVGPLSADTLFIPKYLDHADAVLAMYHDQGLPVLKHMGFGQAVNVTLGLPIIRTSVDHGTALELAGSGKADIRSLVMAIDTAVEMVGNSR